MTKNWDSFKDFFTKKWGRTDGTTAPRSMETSELQDKAVERTTDTPERRAYEKKVEKSHKL